MGEYVPAQYERPSRRRRIGSRIFGSLFALAGVAGGLLLFTLVNGGLTYRQSCARSDGTVATDWTYRWFAPIPYLLSPSREGCETHTATRVLLSKIGLWTLPHHNAGQIAASTTTDAGTAYYGEIYSLGNQLAEAAKAKDRAKFRSALRDGNTLLATLAPPDYLASDAAEFRKAWAATAKDFDAAVATQTQEAASTLSADVTHLSAVAQRIINKVEAHRTK